MNTQGAPRRSGGRELADLVVVAPYFPDHANASKLTFLVANRGQAAYLGAVQLTVRDQAGQAIASTTLSQPISEGKGTVFHVDGGNRPWVGSAI